MHTDVSNIKINLTLDILNLRNDGYHNIDSLFLEVDYGDKISFDPTSAFPIKVKGFDVPEDDSNLVCRAHALFCEHFGIKREGGFHLCKKVPPGSGFGSGSSNAWSVFRILSNFYGLKIDNDDLQGIATKIGSDVFYFSQGGACRVSGLGENIEKVQIENEGLQVVFGAIDEPVLTPDAYGWWDLSGFESGNSTNSFFSNPSISKLGKDSILNDLERVICLKREKIKFFLNSYRKDYGFISMTGSGNGIFTLCKEGSDLNNIMSFFEKHCDYGPKIGSLII